MLWVLIKIASASNLMSTLNIYFDGEQTKIILQLSSDTHPLICSSDYLSRTESIKVSLLFSSSIGSQ